MAFDNSSDEQLVSACLSGDKSAFDIIVERYQERLIKFAWDKVRDYQDAQDAVQDTWVKVYQHLNDFEDTRKFSSWLYKTCQNCCFNKLQEKSRNRFNNFSALPKDIEKLKYGPFREVAEGLQVRDRILAVLNHEEHRLWELVVTKCRHYEAICQDEKLFRDKTEDELRQKFGEIMHKVWEQRKKEIAKWMPKKKPQMDTD